MQVVLDTNVLYHLSGAFPNAQRSHVTLPMLQAEGKLVVTSITWLEVANKLSADLPALRKLIAYATHNKFDLVQIGFAPVDMDDLATIVGESDQLASTIVDNLVTIKIALEAQLLSFIYLGVASGYVSGMLNEVRKESTEVHDKLFASATRMIDDAYAAKMIASFHDHLTTGYQSGKPEQTIKAAFNSELEGIVRAVAMLLTATFLGKKVHLGMPVEDCMEILSAERYKDYTKDFSDEDVSATTAILKRMPLSSHTGDFSKGLINYMGADSRFTQPSLEYLDSRLNKLFVGGKQQKNDTMDMLIIYSLALPNTKIATMDSDFAKALRTAHKDSYDLCTRLGLI